MRKIIEFIKELRKKPYGKAVMFFSFYLIFFIILFIILGVAGNRDIVKNYDNNKTIVNVKSIIRKNYEFTYEVILDDNTYTYNINKESGYKYNYIYDNKEYYQAKSKTYVKESDWVLGESPIKYNKLIEGKNIENIVNSSYLESKTSYDNGNTVYNLIISSNTLNKLLDDKDTDIDEVPNKIVVTVDGNNNISEIKYDLDSYCKVIDSCKEKLKVELEYSKYGEKK